MTAMTASATHLPGCRSGTTFIWPAPVLDGEAAVVISSARLTGRPVLADD